MSATLNTVSLKPPPYQSSAFTAAAATVGSSSGAFTATAPGLVRAEVIHLALHDYPPGLIGPLFLVVCALLDLSCPNDKGKLAFFKLKKKPFIYMNAVCYDIHHA